MQRANKMLFLPLPLIKKNAPLYLRTTPPAVKIQINARACRQKFNIMPTSRLPLCPRTRSRRGKQGERRARGIEADLRRERSNKLKKKLEIVKCRDSGTEADTVKKIVPMLCLGIALHYFIYVYNIYIQNVE